MQRTNLSRQSQLPDRTAQLQSSLNLQHRRRVQDLSAYRHVFNERSQGNQLIFQAVVQATEQAG